MDKQTFLNIKSGPKFDNKKKRSEEKNAQIKMLNTAFILLRGHTLNCKSTKNLGIRRPPACS